MSFQKTLARVAHFEGIGLHTGKKVHLSVYPAPSNSGYLLKRKDITEAAIVPMLANRVQATSMATTVGSESFTVSTVEHCLSAAHALELDNLIFEVDGPEFPILDGSAELFFKGFESAGILQQTAPKNYIVVKDKIQFQEADKSAVIEPYMGFKVTATIDFPHQTIGHQEISIEVSPNSFKREISSARTFGFFKDAEELKKRGMALGGSLNNAIILDEKGVMNPGGLRLEKEFVRHKVLDAIGDLATLGKPIRGHLILNKAGHDLMNKLVKTLDEKSSSWIEQNLVY